MSTKNITLDISYFNPKDFVNARDIFEKTNKRVDFLHQDIIGFLMYLGKSARLVNIINHEGTHEEVEELIKDVIEKYDDGNTIIFTTAYISTVEFPEEKYYIDIPGITQDMKKGKKRVPMYEILARESKFISSLGFIDVNFYTNYEYKIAFIYGSTLGNEIFKAMGNFSSEEKDVLKEENNKEGEE